MHWQGDDNEKYLLCKINDFILIIMLWTMICHHKWVYMYMYGNTIQNIATLMKECIYEPVLSYSHINKATRLFITRNVWVFNQSYEICNSSQALILEFLWTVELTSKKMLQLFIWFPQNLNFYVSSYLVLKNFFKWGSNRWLYIYIYIYIYTHTHTRLSVYAILTYKYSITDIEHYLYINRANYIMHPPRGGGLSTLTKELTVATRIIQSSSNELSTW